MKPYRNLTGKSPVRAYRVGEDFIEVQFQDHSAYIYKDSTDGAKTVETMKTLAENGLGLNRYIKQHPKSAKAKVS